MRGDEGGPRNLLDTRALMTADLFAATIGLSSRTIRSYHARGLLPPPARVGRTPCYTEQHLARMRQVVEFQSRGLPLDAVRALLEPDLVLGELTDLGPAIREAVRRQPGLLADLVEAGVLVRHADGTLELKGVRAVLAARTLSGQGASIQQILTFLADAVREVTPHAEVALAEVLDAVEDRLAQADSGWGAIPELAVEIVRVCVTRLARTQPAAHARPEFRRSGGRSHRHTPLSGTSR